MLLRGNDDAKFKGNIHESFGILRVNYDEKGTPLTSFSGRAL
jgi:hypothetical protein